MSELRVEDEGPVRLVTLNRPERLNALTHWTVAELRQLLSRLRVDRTCRVAIVTGAGRGFCAGLDLKGSGTVAGTKELGQVQRTMARQENFASLVPEMRAVPQPIVAAVNGPAVGAGLALALGADLRIAAESARFGVGAIRAGYSAAESGISYLLPRLIGAARAFDLMLTGRMVGAAEAERIGLVSRVVPDDELLDAARALAAEITAHTPFGVRMTKQVMWANLEAGSLHAAIELENRTQALAALTEDGREARAALLERRTPDFHDR